MFNVVLEQKLIGRRCYMSAKSDGHQTLNLQAKQSLLRVRYTQTNGTHTHTSSNNKAATMNVCTPHPTPPHSEWYSNILKYPLMVFEYC